MRHAPYCWGGSGRECVHPECDTIVRLYDADREIVPGTMCRDCATEVIDEYREKLGWHWTYAIWEGR